MKIGCGTIMQSVNGLMLANFNILFILRKNEHKIEAP